MENSATIEEMLDKVIVICWDLCTKHIPLKSVKRHKNQIPRDRKILMQRRNKISKHLSSKCVYHSDKRTNLENGLEDIELCLKVSYDQEKHLKKIEPYRQFRKTPNTFMPMQNKSGE